MPLVILNCKITGGTPKGMGRKLPAITKATLRATAGKWHADILQRHFTPGNDSRYQFDPRNEIYMREIKTREGVAQGKYVKEQLKGQSLRWMRTFVAISGTSKQAVVKMTSPTYFEHPFLGTTIDPKSGRTKHVTRQPNKPNEITQVNQADHTDLTRFAQGDTTMRMELLMRGIGTP